LISKPLSQEGTLDSVITDKADLFNLDDLNDEKTKEVVRTFRSLKSDEVVRTFRSVKNKSKDGNKKHKDDKVDSAKAAEALFNKPGTSGFTVLWKFETKGQVNSSPCIGPDGTVYFGSEDDNVYAINGTTGKQKWEFRTHNDVNSSPIIIDKGTLFVGSDDCSIYAIDSKNGKEKWHYETAGVITANAVLDKSGQVYVGSADGSLYAFDAETGKNKWRSKIGTYSIYKTPFIDSDGNVCVMADNQALTTVDREKGEYISGSFASMESQPSIGPDGTLYAGFFGEKLCSFDGKTRERKWEYKLKEGISSNITIGKDGTLFFGCYDGTLYAVDGKTGKEKWWFKTDVLNRPAHSTPTLGPDGTLYVGSKNGKLYALDSLTGKKKLEYETGGEIESSPAVTPQGIVYVGSKDKCMYALMPITKEEVKVEKSSEAGHSSEEKPKIEKGDGVVIIGGVELDVRGKKE
jgi:eukaryotic-like serine/threonine-protein kinase